MRFMDYWINRFRRLDTVNVITTLPNPWQIRMILTAVQVPSDLWFGFQNRNGYILAFVMKMIKNVENNYQNANISVSFRRLWMSWGGVAGVVVGYRTSICMSLGPWSHARDRGIREPLRKPHRTLAHLPAGCRNTSTNYWETGISDHPVSYQLGPPTACEEIGAEMRPRLAA